MRHQDKQRICFCRRILFLFSILLLLVLPAKFSLPVYAEEAEDTIEEAEAFAEAELETVSVDDTTDENALLEGYLEQELGIRTSSPVSTSPSLKSKRKNNLSVVSQNIYGVLYEQIDEVAAGNRDSAFFTVSIEEAVGSDIWYSYNELGFDYPEEAFADGQITEAATNAMAEKFKELYGTVQKETIINALLADCPYELYWFDKTSGCLAALTPGVSGTVTKTTEGTIKSVKFHFTTIRFYFAVCKTYQGYGYAWGGDTGENNLIVNTEKTAAIQTAIETAKGVASEKANLRDYDKLKAFYDYIRAVAPDANQEAASDNYTGGYGDPWQIIYVFDEDPSTKVVCEGYSKAFQYLFYLSQFDSTEIDSNIVTGSLNDGNHMWNIVKMDDGRNYLVDVTHQKFLLGASGSVSGGYTAGNGYKYTYDEDTLAQYAESELTLTGSNYVAITGITLTCGEESASSGETISRQAEVGETFTCTASVLPTSASNQNVVWSSNAPSVASVDENGNVTALAQGTVTVTAAAKGNSSFKACCEVVVADHKWDDGKITTEATCTKDGVKTYTCDVCSETKTEAIPATGHTFGAWETVSPVTTSAPETQRRTCQACGVSETRTVGSNLSEEGSAADKTSVAGSTLAITTSASEEAPAGAIFRILALRVSSATKTSIKVKWNRVSGASGYIIYGAKCGTKMQQLGKTTETTYTQAGLRKGTYYKYIVTAYQTQPNGTQKVISTSQTVHIVTSGTKYANYKSVKVSKTSKSLKVKKTYKISASAKKKSGKKVKVHRKLRYESSNTGIATVTSSGKVRARSKGKCTIYVYAQDGTYKTVRITVK